MTIMLTPAQLELLHTLAPPPPPERSPRPLPRRRSRNTPALLRWPWRGRGTYFSLRSRLKRKLTSWARSRRRRPLARAGDAVLALSLAALVILLVLLAGQAERAMIVALSGLATVWMLTAVALFIADRVLRSRPARAAGVKMTPVAETRTALLIQRSMTPLPAGLSWKVLPDSEAVAVVAIVAADEQARIEMVVRGPSLREARPRGPFVWTSGSKTCLEIVLNPGDGQEQAVAAGLEAMAEFVTATDGMRRNPEDVRGAKVSIELERVPSSRRGEMRRGRVQIDGVAYPWGMGAVRGSNGSAFTTQPMSPESTTAQGIAAIWPGWGMAWVALSDLPDQVRKLRSED